MLREKCEAVMVQEQTSRNEANRLRGELKQAQRERDEARANLHVAQGQRDDYEKQWLHAVQLVKDCFACLADTSLRRGLFKLRTDQGQTRPGGGGTAAAA